MSGTGMLNDPERLRELEERQHHSDLNARLPPKTKFREVLRAPPKDAGQKKVKRQRPVTDEKLRPSAAHPAQRATGFFSEDDELAEILGRDLPGLTSVNPPSLERGGAAVKLDQTPQAQSLAAEARFYSSSAERLRKEGQSPLSLGLVAGRGDFGETRLGGGLAYAFPVFRANRPERARAGAESARALAEKSVHENVARRRLRLLQEEQAQLLRARSVLTTTALPAAQLAVSAVQETYAAGKAEMLAVLLSRRELSSLSLRRLELLLQEWQLVSEYVEITGDLP